VNFPKKTDGMYTASPAGYAVQAAGHRHMGQPCQQGRIAGKCNTHMLRFEV
jgi:hypothetical protein